MAHDNNGRPDDKAVQDAQALNHAFLSSIFKSLDCRLNSQFGVDSLRDLLNHGFNKTICCLSDRDTLIDLVLEAAEIDFLDE